MTTDFSLVLRRRVAYPLLRRFSPIQRVDANGRKLFADLRDSVIGKLLFIDGHYEESLSEVVAGFDSHLAGHWALDIGANIGLHTLALSHSVGPSGHVLAFEPERHNGDLLRRTLDAAGVTNVILERVAIGDHEGTVSIRVHADNFGDHRVAAATVGDQAVSMTTVDASVAAHRIPDGAIRFAKIDVQGYESSVLRGMQRTIAANPDLIIAIEVFDAALHAAGSSASALVGELRRLGFDGYELHADRLIPMPDADSYRLMRRDASADLVVTRRPEPLVRLLEKLYANGGSASQGGVAVARNSTGPTEGTLASRT